MKKLMKAMLAAGMALSMIACSASEANDGSEEEVVEEVVEEAAELTAEDVEALLGGTWELPDGSGQFAFDNGNLVVTSQGSNLSGTYEINVENMTIDGRFPTSNGDVTISVPFTLEEGVLKLFNNQNVELIKK